MAKAKIYSRTGLPYRKDFELVSLIQKNNDKDAINELWEKYFELRQKKRFEMLKLCRDNKIDITDEFDTYDASAYEKFMAQMPGVRLNEIASKGKEATWTIWIRLNGYWQSMNRDMIGHRIKALKNEVQEVHLGDEDSNQTTSNIDVSDESLTYNPEPLRKIAAEVFNKAFSAMKKDLSPKQLKLLELKELKLSVDKICTSLQVSRTVVKTTLDYAQNRLMANIEAVSKRLGTPMDYAEVVSLIS